MNLFSTYDLSNVFEHHRKKLNERIEKYTNDELMVNSDLLAENCYEEFRIDTVNIDEEDFSIRSLVQSKIKKRPAFRTRYDAEFIEVDGVKAKFYYPFIGDKELFKCKASTFVFSPYPDAEIQGDYLVISYEVELSRMGTETDKEVLIKTLSGDLESVRRGIGYANTDVNAFNGKLKALALSLLSERRKKVEQFYTISTMFEVPLTKTDHAIRHIPMQRKIAPISTTFNNEPYWCISDADYHSI